MSDFDDVDDVESDKLSDEELLADAMRRATGRKPDVATSGSSEATVAKIPSHQPKPGKSLDDRSRWHRSRGRHGEGDLASGESRVGCHAGATDTRDSERSRSLLDLHVETGGDYIAGGKHYTFPNPDVLTVCRECGIPLDLPDERKPGGQPQYCSERCRRDRKNRKRRNGTARKSGKRVLSTYSGAYGVASGQKSAGPQERLATGEVAPWTVPCWAADPWLKFYLAGSVPIGLGRPLGYSDPTGSLATDNVRSGRRCRDSNSIGIPVGKPNPDAKAYVHNVFDAAFDGMDNYRQLALAGKP